MYNVFVYLVLYEMMAKLQNIIRSIQKIRFMTKILVAYTRCLIYEI